MVSMRTPSKQESETSALNLVSSRTPARLDVKKYRGIVNRPMASSVVRAQEEFKLLVSQPDEIDHNLYGRFLGILKDAGIPWRAKRLPESKEDAMHTMNAIVLAINAYQYYQGDVEDAFGEVEQIMGDARQHSHNQATDLGKVSNELAKMKKEFTTQTRTLAKESATSREQVTTLKSRLTQTERDLNDAQTQVKKLQAQLDEEKRRCKALTQQLASDAKPRISRNTNSGRDQYQMRGSFGAANRTSSGRVSAGAPPAPRNASANGRASAPAPTFARSSSTDGPINSTPKAQAIAEGRVTPGHSSSSRPPRPSPLPWEGAAPQSPATSEDSITGGTNGRNGASYDGAHIPYVPIAQTHYGQGAGPAVQPASVAYAQSRGLQPRAMAIGNSALLAGGGSGHQAADSIGRMVLASDYDQVPSSDEEDDQFDAETPLHAEHQHGADALADDDVPDEHAGDEEGHSSGSLSKKKASLKKFMSKLKRPSKEHAVTVPHPA